VTASQPPTGRVHFQLFAQNQAAGVRWRLLSGNNRDLGRSVDSYPDGPSCLVAIKELLVVLDALTPKIRRQGTSQWHWTMLYPTAPTGAASTPAAEAVLVAGARAYDRQIRCEQAAEHFLTNAAIAHVSPDLLLSDTRRWTGASAARRSADLGPDRTRLHGSARP
jgi:hypothetical protein